VDTNQYKSREPNRLFGKVLQYSDPQFLYDPYLTHCHTGCGFTAKNKNRYRLLA